MDMWVNEIQVGIEKQKKQQKNSFFVYFFTAGEIMRVCLLAGTIYLFIILFILFILLILLIIQICPSVSRLPKKCATPTTSPFEL